MRCGRWRRSLAALVLGCFVTASSVACVSRGASLAGSPRIPSLALDLPNLGPSGAVHPWSGGWGLTNPCAGSIPSSPSSSSSSSGGGSGGLLWALLAVLVLPLFIWLGKALWGAFSSGGEAALPPFHTQRLLIGIPLGTVDEMNATAQELADWVQLELSAVHPLATTGDALVILESQKDPLDIATMVATVAADPRVRFAQPDYVYTTSAAPEADPFAELLYGPRLIGADRAHAVTTGRGVKVALIDTGVAAEHVELRDSIDEQIDVSDHGLEPGLHGTALAGILVARPGNGEGVYGVAPDARLIAIKSCESEDPLQVEARCWSSTLARGVDAAVSRDARVLNLSVGGPRDPLVEHLVNAALRDGRFVVAAAGNGGPDASPSYPAALAGVLAVTAVDAAEHLYPDATRGSFVGLAAPGVEIVSVTPSGEYPVFSGTSFATAHAAGALALLLEAKPDLMPDQMGSMLAESARDLGDEGPDIEFGSGLLDTCAALSRLGDDSHLCPVPQPSTPSRKPSSTAR